MFIPQLQALPLLALYYDSDLFSVRADVFCGTCTVDWSNLYWT